MTDAVDMAGEIEAEHLAAALRRAAAPIAQGVAGICDDCEEYMERLVNGRCGYCRDGRLPPSSRLDAPRAAPPASLNQKAPVTMAESKSVTFVATGAVLAEIKRRTANGTSNNRAALDLVEAAIAGAVSTPIAAAPSAEPVGGIDPATLPPIALALLDHDFSFDALFAELFDRSPAPDLSADLAAMTARAEAAEAKLAALREALAA